MLCLLYEHDLDMREAYRNEMEMLIQFQLVVLEMAHNLQKADIKYMFRFIKEKKPELFVLGISIHVPEGDDIDRRFGEVLVQL